ncbi:MAG: biotin/lipoyl-binding protein [Clostridia bacterium]|nr:biotin/lipoyl-binding protein [Clostridia bacterium]
MRNFKVTVDGNVYNVTVEETGLSSSPKILPLEQKIEKQPAATISSGTQLKSPMPGLILDLKVPEGAEVKKGQVIIILEAMKLENDIAAPCDGKVSFVTSKGANVDTDDILAVIS